MARRRRANLGRMIARMPDTPVLLQREPWLRAWEVRCRRFPPAIRFARPWATVPVSVTGTACALHCAHCNGHYLAGMRTLADPAVERASSLLVSGGCDREGRVPVLPHMAAILAAGAGKRLNWHVGLVDEETVLAIKPFVDVVSFDLVGDDETIRQVYGLERSVDDYVRTYQMLRRHVRVIPHLTVGLLGGRLQGERQALALLKDLGAEALVFLVLIPTPGTAYEDRQPPAVEDVIDLLAEARLAFPETPLLLGCMRPSGEYRERLDALAVQAGVNVLVNPARSAVDVARQLGLAVEWSDECCVL
jgi:lipoyl synthase